MAQKVHPTRIRLAGFQQSHIYWYASCNAAGVQYADSVFQSLFENHRAKNMQVEACADRYILCNFWQSPWCVQTYTTDAVFGITQMTYKANLHDTKNVSKVRAAEKKGGAFMSCNTSANWGLQNHHAIADRLSCVLLREDRARQKVNQKLAIHDDTIMAGMRGLSTIEKLSSRAQLNTSEYTRSVYTGKYPDGITDEKVLQEETISSTSSVAQVQTGRFVFMKVHQPSAKNVCDFVTYAIQRGTHPRRKTRLNSFKDIWKAISNRFQPWLTRTHVRRTGDIKGIKISCSGRLQGAELAQTQTRKLGETSVQRFSDKLDYAFAKAQTQYGAIGVKVWLQRQKASGVSA